MKNIVWMVLVAFLAGISVYSVSRYVAAEKESYSLSFDLDQAKGQVGSLVTQKQNLLQTIEKQKQEQAALSSDLTAANDKIAKAATDFALAQKSIDDLNAQLNLLKEENVSLRSQGDTLKSELAGVSQERDTLQTRLGSLAELKKAIRELKLKMRAVIVPQPQEKPSVPVAIQGNEGFIIRDGRSTHPSRVKIEVNPAPVK